MGAENHHESGPQNPEQKEWQGQKWEYLSLNTIATGYESVRASVAFNKEWPDELSKHYDRKIQKLKNSREKKVFLGTEPGVVSLIEILNLLGQEGWELVSSTPAVSTSGTGHPVLFLKRPIIPSEE